MNQQLLNLIGRNVTLQTSTAQYFGKLYELKGDGSLWTLQAEDIELDFCVEDVADIKHDCIYLK